MHQLQLCFNPSSPEVLQNFSNPIEGIDNQELFAVLRCHTRELEDGTWTGASIETLDKFYDGKIFMGQLLILMGVLIQQRVCQYVIR